MVPSPDDLVEVSLEMLAAEIVIHANQGTLHLGDDRLGRIHMGASFRVGMLFLAVDHILVVSHGLSQSAIARASIHHENGLRVGPVTV